MIITDKSHYPVYKNGKINYNSSTKVLIKCDECSKIHERCFRTAIIKETNLCQSCNQKGSRNPRYGKSIQNNPTHKKYWRELGYSEEEVNLEIRKRKSTCKEYWINKGYSEQESLLIIEEKNKSSTKWTIGYWIKKGYSEEEAKLIVKEELSHNHFNGDIRLYNKSFKDIDIMHKESSRLSKHFWIKRGYLEKESLVCAQNEQDIMNSIKHDKGSYLMGGIKKSKWFSDPDNKAAIQEANKKNSKTLKSKCGLHSPIFKEYWIDKGLSIDDAIYEAYKTRHPEGMNGNNSSKSERLFFEELESLLPDIIFERNRFITCNKKSYSPDGKFDNFIIEFNGSSFHLDERFNDLDAKGPYGAEYIDVKLYDATKLLDYRDAGYYVYVVWDHDYITNRNALLEFLVKEIENENYKKRKYWDSRSL